MTKHHLRLRSVAHFRFGLPVALLFLARSALVRFNSLHVRDSSGVMQEVIEPPQKHTTTDDLVTCEHQCPVTASGFMLVAAIMHHPGGPEAPGLLWASEGGQCERVKAKQQGGLLDIEIGSVPKRLR
jgi:hypothetical protein